MKASFVVLAVVAGIVLASGASTPKPGGSSAKPAASTPKPSGGSTTPKSANAKTKPTAKSCPSGQRSCFTCSSVTNSQCKDHFRDYWGNFKNQQACCVGSCFIQNVVGVITRGCGTTALCKQNNIKCCLGALCNTAATTTMSLFGATVLALTTFAL